MARTLEDVLSRAVCDAPSDLPSRCAYADWLEENGQVLKAAAVRDGVIKRFKPPKDYLSSAYTLRKEDIGAHEDGWTVTGEIHEDWYKWVNEFEATHPEHGIVWGDFEDVVFATSEKALKNFMEHHPPEEWDYQGI